MTASLAAPVATASSTHMNTSSPLAHSPPAQKTNANALLGTLEPESTPAAPSWRKQCTLDFSSWPNTITLDMTLRSPPSILLLSMVVEAARLVSGVQHATGNIPFLRLENVTFDSATLSTDDILGSDNDTSTDWILHTSLQEFQPPAESSSGNDDLVRGFKIHATHGHAERSLLLCQGQLTLFQPSETDFQELASKGATDQTATRNTSIDTETVDTISTKLGFGFPKPSAVQLSSSALLIKGQWTMEKQPSENKEFWQNSPRLASALQAALVAGSLTVVGHVGEVGACPAPVLTSIKEVTITPELKSPSGPGAGGVKKTSSPFYTAAAEVDNSSSSSESSNIITMSVTWKQGNDTGDPKVLPEKIMALEGVTFRTPAGPGTGTALLG